MAIAPAGNPVAHGTGGAVRYRNNIEQIIRDDDLLEVADAQARQSASCARVGCVDVFVVAVVVC